MTTIPSNHGDECSSRSALAETRTIMTIDIVDDTLTDTLRVFVGGRGQTGYGQRQTKSIRRTNRKQITVVSNPVEKAANRPSILGTAYDTAWLAGVPSEQSPHSSRYPQCLEWIVDQQHADGSWGGSIRYEHDRVISTLAALASLATFGRHPMDPVRIAAGTRYLWQHGHLLVHEPMELVGFELLLPTLVRRAQKAGIAVPPNLDFYQHERVEKLRLIPPEFLYSTQTTITHSLEFLGDDAQAERLRAAQGNNGAIGNSPATTAFYLSLTNDAEAQAYLQDCLGQADGSAPVLYPCETFDLLWSVYPFFLVGMPTDRLLSTTEQAALRKTLATGGVSLSPTFPIADADDTAVALVLLHELGEPLDSAILQAFASANGYFVSFPHERH